MTNGVRVLPPSTFAMLLSPWAHLVELCCKTFAQTLGNVGFGTAVQLSKLFFRTQDD